MAIDEPQIICRKYPGRAKASQVDMHWKEKSDDQRREEFGLIKYFQVGYWAMPLSLFALAYVFLVAARREYRVAGKNPGIDVPPVVAHILALHAAAFCLFFFVLQVLFPCLQIQRSVDCQDCAFDALTMSGIRIVSCNPRVVDVLLALSSC
jgi:hypothetical protein